MSWEQSKRYSNVLCFLWHDFLFVYSCSQRNWYCRGRLWHLRGYCSTVGLYCATITWKRICKCSLHVTAVGRVAILANLSADSGNRSNFESVWLQIFWFGCFEMFGDFWKQFWSNSFGLAKCSLWPVHFFPFCLHIYMQICYF